MSRAQSDKASVAAGKDRVSGAERFLRVLEALAAGKPLRLNDVATTAKLPVSTAYKLLKELVSVDLVWFDGDLRTYSSGPALHRLSSQLRRSPLDVVARPVLRALAMATGESASLNRLHRERSMFMVLATEESGTPLQYAIEIGGVHPLHAGAGGRAILAHLEPDIRKEYLASGAVTKVTRDTITNKVKLNKALEQTRADGYAVSYGERLAGAVGIAAPVWGNGGRVSGSVQLTIPEFRFAEKRIGLLAQEVIRSAERLRGQLDEV